jgi:hypothetical protein
VNILIYDLEICNAIPPKDDIDIDPTVTYCEGWSDFENMGISYFSWAVLNSDTLRIESAFTGIWDVGSVSQILLLLNEKHDLVAGFNSRKFDDRLLAANGINITTDIDILEEVLFAADQLDKPYWQDGRSYSLDRVTSANNLKKIGTGANAPLLWQKGEFTELALYSVTDAIIEAAVLAKLIEGSLIDPNDGKLLKMSADRLGMNSYLDPADTDEGEG